MRMIDGYGSAMRSASFLLSVLCLAICSGVYIGRLLAHTPPTLSLKPDTRCRVPVVQIDGVQNGLLHGSVVGNARVAIGDDIVVQSGAFALNADILLRNEIWVHVPPNAKFVASKKGKKYYDISEAGGERIVPSNRVYFSSVEEAEQAGYVP